MHFLQARSSGVRIAADPILQPIVHIGGMRALRSPRSALRSPGSASSQRPCKPTRSTVAPCTSSYAGSEIIPSERNAPACSLHAGTLAQPADNPASTSRRQLLALTLAGALATSCSPLSAHAEAAGQTVYLDMSINGEPAGRLVVELLGDAAAGVSRFQQLAKGVGGLSYRCVQRWVGFFQPCHAPTSNESSLFDETAPPTAPQIRKDYRRPAHLRAV